MNRSKFFAALVLSLTISAMAQATTFRFDTDPFAGSDALTTPGRQVVGSELFIPSFSVGSDGFSFDTKVFDVDSPFVFVNSTIPGVPTAADIFVLQTTDNDGDPSTPFGAGTAANLIAGQITTPGAGFFIYFNSGLNLPRLVYSTNLDDNTADLKIVARLTGFTGQPEALPTFAASNFEVSGVPEPSSILLTGGGLAIAALVWKRRQAAAK